MSLGGRAWGVLALALAAHRAWAGDDEVGFADATAEVSQTRESPWTFGGRLQVDEALWLKPDDGPLLARAAHTADLSLRYSRGSIRALFVLHGEVDPVYLSAETDAETRETYGWRAGPRELWIAGTAGPFDIAFGRQVIGWGQGLLVSPLDLVNGQDRREPGLTELEDQRLPSTALRVQWFGGPHRVEAIWMPEANWGLPRPPGGTFGVLPPLLDEAPSQVRALYSTPEYAWEHVPGAFDAEVSQWFLRWTVSIPRVDLSVNAALLRDRRGVIVLPELPPPEVVAQYGLPPEVDLTLEHRRYAAFGTSAAVVAGPFVFRGEVVVSVDRPYNTGDVGLPPTLEVATTDMVEGMVGVTWAVDSTQVIVEFGSGGAGKDYDDALFPLYAFTAAARLRQGLFDDRIVLSANGATFGERSEMGLLGRLDVEVEIVEGLRAGVGLLAYAEGDAIGPVVGLEKRDRAYARLRYEF